MHHRDIVIPLSNVNATQEAIDRVKGGKILVDSSTRSTPGLLLAQAPPLISPISPSFSSCPESLYSVLLFSLALKASRILNAPVLQVRRVR